MKNVISIFAALVMSVTPAFAKINTVADDVAILGQLAMGTRVFSVAGGSAEEIFSNYLEQYYGEDDDRELLFKEIEDMDYGDETREGFTSTKSAIAMSSFAESSIEEAIDNLKHEPEENAVELKNLKGQIYDLKHGWMPVIKRLANKGVVFGYTGNGPGYCGISFIQLIIIDAKAGKVYEVYLSIAGEC